MNDDELGDVLRDALRAHVRHIQPSRNLIDRVEQIGAAPGPTRLSSRRRLLAAIPIPIAAAIAAVIIALGGSEVTPSFAVIAKPGGEVFVTIHDLSGVAGANAELRRLGVPAVVVPMTTNCRSRVALTYLGVRTQSVRLSPSTVPPHTTILLAARQIASNKVEMAFGSVTGTPPTCVSANGTGPGLGAFSPSQAGGSRGAPGTPTEPQGG